MPSRVPIRFHLASLCLGLCVALPLAHAQANDPARDKAARAFEQLRRQSPAADATWDAERPGVALLTGLQASTHGQTPRARAEGFLRDQAELLGVAAADFSFVALEGTSTRTVARFAQNCPASLGGLPVYNRFLTIAMDRDGRVRTVSSDAAPVPPLVRGSWTAAQAREAAVRAVFQSREAAPTPAAKTSEPREVVLVQGGQSRHAFVVDVVYVPLADQRRVLVDARDGRILGQFNTVMH